MSVSTDFEEYKYEVLSHPEAKQLIYTDTLGYTFHYYKIPGRTFGVILDRNKRFYRYLREVTVH